MNLNKQIMKIRHEVCTLNEKLNDLSHSHSKIERFIHRSERKRKLKKLNKENDYFDWMEIERKALEECNEK